MTDEFTARLIKRDPDPDLMECLESLLARARKGELRTLIYLAVFDDGVDTGNVGHIFDRHTLIGYIEAMKLDFWARRREADTGMNR